MTPLDGQEARRRVERALHSPITDKEWQLLEAIRYVDEITTADEAYTVSEAVRNAAGEIKRGRRTWGQPVKSSAPRPRFVEGTLAKARNEALSLALAADAAKDESVVAFRAEVLGGELLTLASIDEWVKQQLERDVQADSYRATVRLPREAKVGDTVTMTLTPHNMRPQLDVLEYPREGWDTPAQIEVEPGGLLGWIRRVSDRLAIQYDWQLAEAVAFLLAGLPPYRPSLRVVTKVHRVLLGARVSAKVVLEVDPTTSYAEVAEAYRSAQLDLLDGKQYRALSEKALNLAVFLHANQPRPKWADLMAAWNREHADRDDWQFSDWRRFQRDAVQAHDRLFDPLRESLGRSRQYSWLNDPEEAE